MIQIPANATFEQELVDCGKTSCRRCVLGPSHGPYLFAYWRDGGRIIKRYLGKNRENATINGMTHSKEFVDKLRLHKKNIRLSAPQSEQQQEEKKLKEQVPIITLGGKDLPAETPPVSAGQGYLLLTLKANPSHMMIVKRDSPKFESSSSNIAGGSVREQA